MSDVIHDFTTEVPEWRPRVTPVDLAKATPEAQLDAIKVTPSNTKVSDYVLTLAHDVEILKERSPLFNAIMYNRGGLGRTRSRTRRDRGLRGQSLHLLRRRPRQPLQPAYQERRDHGRPVRGRRETSGSTHTIRRSSTSRLSSPNRPPEATA